MGSYSGILVWDNRSLGRFTQWFGIMVWVSGLCGWFRILVWDDGLGEWSRIIGWERGSGYLLIGMVDAMVCDNGSCYGFGMTV